MQAGAGAAVSPSALDPSLGMKKIALLAVLPLATLAAASPAIDTARRKRSSGPSSAAGDEVLRGGEHLHPARRYRDLCLHRTAGALALAPRGRPVPPRGHGEVRADLVEGHPAVRCARAGSCRAWAVPGTSRGRWGRSASMATGTVMYAARRTCTVPPPLPVALRYRLRVFGITARRRHGSSRLGGERCRCTR